MASMENAVRYVEVCDLPYYTEPGAFYERRMTEGMTVTELRRYATSLFGKERDQLTVRDMKLAFLKRFPFSIALDGKEHKVSVKKYDGKWILSCDCGAWVFNLNGHRSCRHTTYVERMFDE
jgi:hypothetical protein